MLSDEEKKTIEVLQYVKNKTPFIFWYEDKPYNKKETINTILNLIEKQSKKIEELENRADYLARISGLLSTEIIIEEE